MNDWTKIGIGLIASGILFNIFGVLLLFDRGFLAMGSLMYLMGFPLVMGIKSAADFFFKVTETDPLTSNTIVNTKKLMYSCIFFSGFFSLFFFRFALFGFVLEMIGGVPLFFQFIPKALNFLRELSGIGWAFEALRFKFPSWFQQPDSERGVFSSTPTSSGFGVF